MEKIIKREIYTGILASIIFCIIGVFFMLYPVKTMNIGLTLIEITLMLIGILTIVSHIRCENFTSVFNQGFIYGIVTVILSIFLMVNPKIGISIVPIVVGIWMVLGSLMKIQIAVNIKDLKQSIGIFTMISALLMFICGIIAICNPIRFSMVIVTLLGIIFVVYSIIEVFNSLFLLDYVKESKDLTKKVTKKAK